MTGLRARQKADRNRRILEAATTLFREQGYDSARIEDIAEMAEVSVGTLYNYYQNKGDILVATVSMEVTEVLEAGEMIVANPPLNVNEALSALINQYYDHSLVYLSKEMWRTAMASSIQQPETPLSKRYTELDQRLCAQVVQLIETLQRRGVVIAGVDTRALGEVFFNNLNLMFIEFCKVEAMPLEELKARVAEQHRPIAALISSVKPV
ncbi:MAG: TetR/AcrR family transcriptional regulator [Alphaproteobacteria bacterium]|nr:TetR/AcrR family transcriptional regulator [Rhizobiaceae bacterium]MBU3963144.1 TetR/AcrR family transcriptional regulator [Alphaproteobacteria bacterium]MBU4048746.1 TetR/AcrR family transcriptional regulator [Alphaproteobacteria bacterium]MBU4088487.1 TetR/AcrR family transcriptional regulator [Alphaproteobacteria bacterium]MBU4158901.1 TetR/AcrR family transcriptional regulator [Alphaproteobacteria bacterium]